MSFCSKSSLWSLQAHTLVGIVQKSRGNLPPKMMGEQQRWPGWIAWGPNDCNRRYWVLTISKRGRRMDVSVYWAILRTGYSNIVTSECCQNVIRVRKGQPISKCNTCMQRTTNTVCPFLPLMHRSVFEMVAVWVWQRVLFWTSHYCPIFHCHERDTRGPWKSQKTSCMLKHAGCSVPSLLGQCLSFTFWRLMWFLVDENQQRGDWCWVCGYID
jgi:hypothetical protein